MLMDTRPQSDHGFVMKDRLAELLAISNIVDDITFTMAPNVYMKEFFIKVREVRGIIEKISSQVDEVERSHSVILSAPNPGQRTKAELEQLNNDIKKNASTVQAKLKSMHESLSMYENGNNSSADQRIQKNQHSDLTRSFVEVMTIYNNAQITFREKCKARIRRQLEITGKITTDEELEELLHSGNPAVFTADMVSDSQTTRQALSEIESRHQDIILLETNIRELQEMFVDIAVLVETQGDVINNIEKNVSTAVDYVDQAKGETKKAVVYQKRARRKHVIIALVVVVLLAVIALAVGLSVGLPKA